MFKTLRVIAAAIATAFVFPDLSAEEKSGTTFSQRYDFQNRSWRFEFIWTLHVLFLLMVCVQSVNGQGDSTHEVDSLNDNSFLLRNTDRTAAAQSARQAYRMSQAISYEKGLSEAKLNLAISHTLQNHYDSALFLLREINGELADPLKALICEYFLGRVYSALHSYKLAKDHFDAAEKMIESNAAAIRQKAEMKDYFAAVPNSLGTMEMRQGNHNAALGYFSKAMETQMKAGSPFNKELNNIALAYLQMKNYPMAKQFMKRSLKLTTELADTAAMVITATNLGTAYKDLSEFDSALFFYDSAYRLAARKKLLDIGATALLQKSDLMIKTERYEEAMSLLRRNIATVNKFNLGNLSNAYQNLAIVFQKINRLDSAIMNARKALQLSVAAHYLVVAQSSSLMLSGLFRKIHRPDSAFKYIDLHSKYRAEYEKANNESQFSDLRIRIETLEKDNEINTLQAAAELDRLKNQRLFFGLTSLAFLALLAVAYLFFRNRMAKRKNEYEQLQLRAELEKNKENLYKQTLNMIHINNRQSEISDHIKAMLASQFDMKLAKVANLIKTNKTLDTDWKNFNDYFGNVHADFYSKLSNLRSDLTIHEKRICALIRLNLTNREMATLLNIEPRSVIMLKYRIKKKLQITEAEALEVAIQKL